MRICQLMTGQGGWYR
nr:hypothetical protein P5621_22045 [Bacillus subtilis]